MDRLMASCLEQSGESNRARVRWRGGGPLYGGHIPRAGKWGAYEVFAFKLLDPPHERPK